MEKSPGSDISIKVEALNAGWNDLGAWDAVWQVGQKEGLSYDQGNVSQGDALLVNIHNTFTHASSRLVAVVGVNDLIIIEAADAVLVADRNQSQHVKKIVAMLDQQQRTEHMLHRKVHRPWGWYDSIDGEDRFKVKRIKVKPGASLSLQMHHHRAEHWIVVKGTAEVTCGDKVVLLSESQSTSHPWEKCIDSGILAALHLKLLRFSRVVTWVKMISFDLKTITGAVKHEANLCVHGFVCRV